MANRGSRRRRRANRPLFVTCIHAAVVALMGIAPALLDAESLVSRKRNSRNASLKFATNLGSFVEGMQGNEVLGWITPIGGLHKDRAGFGPGLSHEHPAGGVGAYTRRSERCPSERARARIGSSRRLHHAVRAVVDRRGFSHAGGG